MKIKDYDTNDFYNLKRELLKGEHLDLIQIFEVLESMIEKRHNDLMNRRLNLLTIWSTIFLMGIIILYWIVGNEF